MFQKIQEMEERRIVRIGESMKTFADVDRQVIPIIGKCLDEITKAAESVDHKNVSVILLVLLTVIFRTDGFVCRDCNAGSKLQCEGFIVIELEQIMGSCPRLLCLRQIIP